MLLLPYVVLEVICKEHWVFRGQLPASLLALWPFEVECPMCGADLGCPTILGRSLSFEPFRQEPLHLRAWGGGPRWQPGVEALKRYQRKRARDPDETL